jgi:anaerobic selenocysteine-containing dehydrogenase
MRNKINLMGIVKSTCGLCYAGCGVLIHMRDGKPVQIEGDPESPVNRGVVCEKAMASLEYLYHPERLRYPLKRAGNRGEGNWQRMTWDEAVKIIADRLRFVKEGSGAESVVFIHGAAKGLQETYLKRFANVFGSPNVASQGHVCFLSRKFGSITTLGYYPNADYDYPPRCIVVWGSNKAKIAEFQNTLEAVEKGARLIVMDPRKTELSRRSDAWVRLRPGSDVALALGMIKVIIDEELYDKSFVEKWTVGFEELRVHVRGYPPERVEQITWVNRDLVKEIARMYATLKPAFIQMGNAFEHTINSFQTARAISILKALTGNLSVPGGEIYREPLPMPDRYAPELSLDHMLPDEKKMLRLGAKSGFAPFYQYAHPPAVVKAMREGKPYPLRMAYIQGANPLLTYPNAKEVYKALVGLEFLVVADLFMTPTAALADIVLPSASYFEFDSIVNPPYYPIAQVQQEVAELYECWPDFRTLKKLAQKADMGEYFWDNEKDFLDLILRPAGITFDNFREQGSMAGEIVHYHYKKGGFNTPSGKVELFSTQMKEWGFDPLPVYHEPPETPYGDPELAKEYPLILTSWKSEYYRHSGQRQLKSLRGKHPDPLVYVNPETAIELGIDEGDWVWVATRRGRIRQKAVLSEEIDPRVVGVDYAWWFPERGAGDLYGWSESNINILTDDGHPYSRELGTPNLRGMLCKVSTQR